MSRLSEMGAVAALSIAMAGVTLQGQGVGGQDSTAPPAQRSGEARPAIDARNFIDEMTIAGMAEVQLGQLAVERAASPDVKAFGRMMVTDHMKANDELTRIAVDMNIQPPTQLDQKHKDLAARLSTLQGAAFDREYMDAMVQGHQDVVNALRTRAGNRSTSNTTTGNPTAGSPSAAGTSGTPAAGRPPADTQAVGTSGSGDAALTQWATSTLPIVQQHLDRARMLRQTLRP